MRILIVIAALAPLTLAQTEKAEAQNYPWCADYAMQGTSNCGFATLQQCHAALSGNGGYCRPNPMFRPYPGDTSPSRRVHR